MVVVCILYLARPPKESSFVFEAMIFQVYFKADPAKARGLRISAVTIKQVLSISLSWKYLVA